MGASLPAWVGPTAAISLLVIALSFVAIAVATALVARKASTEIGELSEELGKLRAELSGDVRSEVEKYLEVSKALRHDLERGVRRVKHKLADLDALYEVVHEEVEDTALDVAAKLSAVRDGAGMVSRIRRWMVRGRR
jgi:uncharacterized protein YoxC